MLIEKIEKPIIRDIAVLFNKVKIEEYNGVLCSFHGYIDWKRELTPGIRVFPDLIIPENFEGYIYISQFVDNTSVYKFSDGHIKHFCTNGQVADGHYHNHYSIYHIYHEKCFNYDPKKLDEILLSDSPRQQLSDNLVKLEYKAKFEIFFQYSEGEEMLTNLKKLCSFKWQLKFDVVRTTAGWLIENQQDFGEAEIKNSFITYDACPGIDPRAYKEVRQLFNEFQSKE